MLEKKLLLTIAAAMLFTTLHAQPARAQTETPLVEIGVHFSSIRLSPPPFSRPPICFEGCQSQFDTFWGVGAASGVGGRITFNFNKHVAAEGEFNFFPNDLPEARPERSSLSGQQTQGLFGLKAGMRSRRAGVFGKVRPGYMRFWRAPEGIVCAAVFPAPFACEIARRGSTSFALDFGGVVEFYPSRRTVVRFDLGDTVVNFRGPFFEGRSLTTHNLQFNAGVGFRF